MSTTLRQSLLIGAFALSAITVSRSRAADIPHRIYVGSFFEQEVFDQTAPGTECYPGAPCQYSGSSLLRIWDPTSAGFEQYVTSPSCVDENGEPWCGGQNVTTRWPETTWPPQGLNGTQTTRTYFTDCTSTAQTNTVGPMFGIPWVHRDITTTEWWEGHRCFWDDGTLYGPVAMDWHPTLRRRADTTIMLYTGIEDILPIPGPPPPGSAMGPALFRIRAPVTDVDTGLPINPTNVTVQGVRAGASGDIFLLANENIHVNVTPQTPAAFRNTQYDVTAEKSKPQIWRTLPDGSRTNITDRTQIVCVGEQIDLTCSATGSWTNFTNCAWTVPGITVAGWNPTPTQAVVIPFTNRNSGVIRYYWVDGHAAAEVRCVINISGTTFNLQTTFEVRRPDVTWQGAVTGSIAADYNFVPFQGILSLHFGRGGNTAIATNNGISFSLSNVDLKGYTNSFRFLSVQVGSNLRRFNGVDGRGYQADGSGLDTVYPYRTYGLNLTNVVDGDSPGQAISPGLDVMVYKANNFATYLMFKPLLGPSVEVPLKVFAWNWAGKATNYSPIGGSWGLQQAVYPTSLITADTVSYPAWSNNIANVVWTTNGTWFP